MTTSLVVKRFLWAGVALGIIMIVGTTGYWFIGREQYSFLDCFYMTFIISFAAWAALACMWSMNSAPLNDCMSLSTWKKEKLKK